MDKDVRIFSGDVVTLAQGDSRVVTFRASTFAKDRHHTRIKPDGINTDNFTRNPVFLWGHDGYGGWSVPQMENVIGRVIATRKSTDAFDIDVEFAEESVNPKGAMAHRMTKAGLLSTVSIGFIPTEVKVITEGSSEVPIIEKAELLEVSLVPIPSNPEAVALVRSMSGAADVEELMREKELQPEIAAALRSGRLNIREQFLAMVREIAAAPATVTTAPAAPVAADPAVVAGQNFALAVRSCLYDDAFSDAVRRSCNSL